VCPRDFRGNDSFNVELADIDYWRRQIKCQDACPVHTDARGYIRAVAEGEFRRAYLIARGPNPFASICGRVCGAPCEAACRRGDLDEPISIRALKRFACEKSGPEKLLAELEAEDTRELLDIQIYMTGARDDLKSSSLVLARELLYARTSADVITGLHAKTNMGRPDWEPLLTSILRQHAPDPVDVYMCGPRGLVRVVDATCRRLGMNFRHEVF